MCAEGPRPVSADTARPRIAVIAVHGVADQQPGESAEAIGALLLNLAQTQERSWLYEPFATRAIHIPLSPAVAANVRYTFDFALALEENARRDEERAAGPAKFWRAIRARLRSTFRESRPGYRETLVQGSSSRKPRVTGDESEPFTGEHLIGDQDAGLTYMRSLLGNYPGDIGRRSYITTRLEGARRSTVESDPIDIDVYEMYWADLSKIGTGPVRVFTALYQLVLHVAELGRRALEDGLSEFGLVRRWKRLVGFQEMAVRILTIPIPLLNLFLLFVVLNATLVGAIAGDLSKPDIGALRVAVILAAIVFAVLAAYSFASKRVNPSARAWWFVPLVSVALGAAIGDVLVRVSGDLSYFVFAAECWLASLALMDMLLNKYERVRPGALASGRVISGLVTAFFIWAIVVALVKPQAAFRELEYASLWTVQFLTLLLSLSLVSLFAFALLAALSGHRMVSSLRRASCARARAAVRTSRLTLAISASTMLGVVTVFWSALLAWASVVHVAAFECMETLIFPPFDKLGALVAQPEQLRAWFEPAGTPGCGSTFEVVNYFRVVLLMGTTTGLPLNLILVALSLLLLVWMAIPSVIFEGEAPSSCTNKDSRKAGVWLSRGLDATKIVTHTWWAAVFAVSTVFGIVDLLARREIISPLFSWSKDWAVPILSMTGSLVAASSAAIFFGIAKFGGSALDVLLDVDNYLRERPLEGTPRARIAERYASLLRHVAHDRSKGNRPYDAIVIVAHSLGALITADLLRFFRSESNAGRGDPDLAPIGFGQTGEAGTIPIHLFTMGNPLRQLLSRFFPHQYRWVRSSPDNSMKPLGDPLADPAMPRSPRPSPRTLGVTTWSNAYRSGDYVGRGLWLDEWFARTKGLPDEGRYPQPIEIPSNGGASEMCIGLGAHTHYWDHTAPDIRDYIDNLIVRAAALPGQQSRPDQQVKT